MNERAVQAPAGEPVAYQYRRFHPDLPGEAYPGWGEWMGGIDRETYERWKGRHDMQVRPLYAAPVQAVEQPARCPLDVEQPGSWSGVQTLCEVCGNDLAKCPLTAVQPARELSDDEIERLGREHLSQEQREALYYTKWKDGIDIRYARPELLAFARAIRSRT